MGRDTGFDNLRRIVSHRWEKFTTENPGSGTRLVEFGHLDRVVEPGL